MKIIMGAIKEFNDDALIMAKQLGSEGFHFNTPPIATEDEDFWTVRALTWLKEYTEKFDLKLEMIENVPVRFFDKIMLGTPGRDEQIENYIKTIRNMGQVGIPVLGHHFCPTWAWRTSITAPARGGAKVSAFNSKEAEAGVNAYTVSAKHMVDMKNQFPDAEGLWKNYEYFVKAVMPEAEKAGIKLIVHPSDPPIRNVAGVDRIFICPDDFRKAEKIASSEAFGINFCIGTFSQLGGEETVLEMIEEFVTRGKVHMVHFRDVQGTVEDFQECFLGEGRMNPARIMRALYKAGYDGLMLDDHVPFLTTDTRWGHTARANAVGYLRGLLNAIELYEQ
ncbi:MAG: mannonate dehydratase [Oscillospiraceae bacterium]|nr:mannonate dehydratase [Oscillospiraceae bacterium]